MVACAFVFPLLGPAVGFAILFALNVAIGLWSGSPGARLGFPNFEGFFFLLFLAYFVGTGPAFCTGILTGIAAKFAPRFRYLWDTVIGAATSVLFLYIFFLNDPFASGWGLLFAVMGAGAAVFCHALILKFIGADRDFFQG